MRIGIVGTNFVSDWMADAIASEPDFTAAAVYSRARETGEAFAAGHFIESVYTDYGAMLNDRGIDAVYIASPNICHYEQALSAIRSGKHVLIEKPMTLCRAQAEAVFEAARARGVAVLEAIRPVYDPFLDAVRGNLPRIGAVRRVCIEHCKYSSRYDRFKRGDVMNAFDPSLGNAALMDIGVYCVQVVTALFGAPDAVSAYSTFLPNGMEASGTALLSYDGFQAELVYSKVTSSVFYSQIMGEDGIITFDALHEPSYVRIVPRGGSPEALPYEQPAHNMVYLLRELRRMAEGGSPDKPNAQTLVSLSVMDDIRAAAGITFGTPPLA